MAFDSRLLSGVGVLAAVVEAGSFVRAGETLGMTQSGVSRAVARLEQRVGVKLFHRTARSVALTEEGRTFFETVQPHLARIEEAAEEAAGSATVVRGRLRVNVAAAFANHVLAPAIGRFLDRHPHLTMEIAVRDRMGDLVAEGFDVAIRPGDPQPSALVARLLLRTQVLTCASPEYVARRGLPKHPRELEQHECILFRDSVTGAPFAWEFSRRKETVPVAARGSLMVNDTGALMGAMLGGHGIGQPLALNAQRFLREGRLVQLLPDWAEETYPFYAYHQSQRLMSAKVRVFLDFLRELTRQETVSIGSDLD
jgi:DNA-binding transcriptional LysR family regulator